MPRRDTLLFKAILIAASILAAAPVEAAPDAEPAENLAVSATEEAAAPESTITEITAPLLAPPEIATPPPEVAGTTPAFKALTAHEKIRNQFDVTQRTQLQAASSEACADLSKEDLARKNKKLKAALKAALERAEEATKLANKLLEEERARRKRAANKLNGASRSTKLR